MDLPLLLHRSVRYPPCSSSFLCQLKEICEGESYIHMYFVLHLYYTLLSVFLRKEKSFSEPQIFFFV